MEREDLLTIAIDIFPTDTTDYADYILPAASFIECDDLVIPYFDLTVSAQSKAMEPMGESLSSSDIFRKLAKGMDYKNPALYKSDLDILDCLIRQTGLDETFDSLKTKGTVPISLEPIILFQNLSFETPSKKNRNRLNRC